MVALAKLGLGLGECFPYPSIHQRPPALSGIQRHASSSRYRGQSTAIAADSYFHYYSPVLPVIALCITFCFFSLLLLFYPSPLPRHDPPSSCVLTPPGALTKGLFYSAAARFSSLRYSIGEDQERANTGHRAMPGDRAEPRNAESRRQRQGEGRKGQVAESESPQGEDGLQ